MIEKNVDYKIKVNDKFQREEAVHLLGKMGVTITNPINFNQVSVIYLRWTGHRHMTTYDKDTCFYDHHIDRKPLTLVDLVLMEG